MHFPSKSALGLATLLAVPAHAYVRMTCSQLVTQRVDPLITPGLASSHVHQVNGGNGFGFTESYNSTQDSTCTSCDPKEDLSNYWTPILYYQDKQDNFTRVPQKGGMTVYYQQRGTDLNRKAFPEGFRMIAGDAFKRSNGTDFASQAVSFACLSYSDKSLSYLAGQYSELPTHECPDGMRAQIYFPSCWDGVNLDSADHKSHVSYPATGGNDGGTCPDSHPVQLISIFYEVMFSTIDFDFWEGKWGTGQPFVFAMGDPQGYGFHGDFVNGWKAGVLQNVVDTCNNDSGLPADCPAITLNSASEKDQCNIPPSISEDINGPFAAMPGCNPVQPGPAEAVPAKNCSVTAITGPVIPFTDMTSLSWSYQGCAGDGHTRTLTGSNNIYSPDQATTTVDGCLKTCVGFTYAGLEDGKQCFCGNDVASDRAPSAIYAGSCNMDCNGNSTQICGGPFQLSLYKVCPAGTSCTNDYVYKSVGDLTGTVANALVSSSGNATTSQGLASTSTVAAVGSSGSASSVASEAASLSSSAAVEANSVGSGHVSLNPPKPSTGIPATITDLATGGTCGTSATVTSYVTVTATTGAQAKVKKHAHLRNHARKAAVAHWD